MSASLRLSDAKGASLPWHVRAVKDCEAFNGQKSWVPGYPLILRAEVYTIVSR